MSFTNTLVLEPNSIVTKCKCDCMLLKYDRFIYIDIVILDCSIIVILDCSVIVILDCSVIVILDCSVIGRNVMIVCVVLLLLLQLVECVTSTSTYATHTVRVQAQYGFSVPEMSRTTSNSQMSAVCVPHSSNSQMSAVCVPHSSNRQMSACFL